MSKRDEEKRKSLDALARIAYSAGSAPTPPAKPAAPPAPRPAPRAAPKPAPRAPPATRESSAERARQKQLDERRAKLAEEKALRERRKNEMARSARIDTSRIDPFNIPASIRRTGFDRHEPTVSQKIQDVLGDTREKEGRAKARDKGKRVGGGR